MRHPHNTESAMITPLSEAFSKNIVGSKAANLWHLIDLGFDVPAGFVVNVRAFSAYIHASATSAQPGKSCETEFASGFLAEEFIRQFETAWDTLVHGKVAVRSSSVAEDSESASYAGQFSTSLNITSKRDALAAILECWKSSRGAGAAAYSQNMGMNPLNADMAVIVQDMIEAEFAGVAFTRDPLHESPDVFYAEWVRGLGESLVSGDRVDGRVWCDKLGAPLRFDYYSETCPPQELWNQLAKNLDRLRSNLESHQDVEWAWRDGKLFLLQTRPITVSTTITPEIVPEWKLPGKPKEGWTDTQRMFFELWDEYNPSVVYPLDYEMFMGSIWQGSLDMLAIDSFGPRITAAVVRVSEVPVAIDPACRQDPAQSHLQVGKVAPSLAESLRSYENSMDSYKLRLDSLHLIESMQLLNVLDEISEKYRDITSTRLLHMNSWIAGEEEAKGKMRDILRQARISDIDGVLDTLSQGVEHDTHEMLKALGRLAKSQRASSTGKWERDVHLFMEQFGHYRSGNITLIEMGSEFKSFMGKTVGQSRDIEGDLLALESSRTQLIEEIARKLDGDMRREFITCVNSLEYWIKLRENSKMRQEKGRVLIGKILAECKRRTSPLINECDDFDIRLLTRKELREALLSNSHDRSTLLRRMSIIDWKRNRSWLPRGFRGKEVSIDDREFAGEAASEGVARGVVKRIAGPEQFAHLRAGEILVAKSTDPVWTQLFQNAAAVIVENGSKLSHAAIVARELRIPAVVGIPGIFECLTDGEMVKVDGNEGIITRILPVARPD